MTKSHSITLFAGVLALLAAAGIVANGQARTNRYHILSVDVHKEDVTDFVADGNAVNLSCIKVTDVRSRCYVMTKDQ